MVQRAFMGSFSPGVELGGRARGCSGRGRRAIREPGPPCEHRDRAPLGSGVWPAQGAGLPMSLRRGTRPAQMLAPPCPQCAPDRLGVISPLSQVRFETCTVSVGCRAGPRLRQWRCRRLREIEEPRALQKLCWRPALPCHLGASPTQRTEYFAALCKIGLFLRKVVFC